MKTSGLRWWVVGLVALAAVINYIDRQAFGALWPEIAEELFPGKSKDYTKEIYGTISAIFILSYAAGQTIFGKIFDWIGFAKGMITFSIFRSILGIAEAGNWPGAAKANAEWFPTKERAFAQGIFNSGAAIGGIVAYPIIGLLSIYLSWQAIFVCVGLIGFLWLLPWLYIVKAPPQSHPWLTEDEKTYILSGQKNQDLDSDGEYDEGYNPSTGELLERKESWGIILASAAIDPIWWLFIVWIPIYLNEVFGMDVKDIAFSAWVPYVGAMIGAWFGGAIGNVQTLPSDMFSGKVVGTLSGFAGTAAKLGAFGLTILIPRLTAGGNYAPAFLIGGALAVIALLAVWVLCPKIQPLKPKY